MENKNKGWLRVLAIILPYIIIVGIFQVIGAITVGADLLDLNYDFTSKQETVISLFTLLGTFLTLWVFMKYVDKEKFINLGFSTEGRLKEFIIGFLVGALVMIFGYLLLSTMDEIKFEKIVVDPIEIVYSVLFYTFVSVSEEVFTRGYILRNFMQSFNKYIALVVSSLIFAVMHLANPNMDWFSFLGLFVAGILLGISYIYTRNLWFPIALHLSWNLFQTLFGFNVSGQDFYSLIEFKITDNNLLNGGDFGFEGSIFSIVFELVIIASVWVYYRRKSNKVDRIG